MPAHVEAHAAVLQAAKVVVAQLETPLASVLLALRLARQGGATTVLNAAPAATLSAQQLSVVDWLVVNESEAQALVGLPAGDAAHGGEAPEVPAEALRFRTLRMLRGERVPNTVLREHVADGHLAAE